jgi:hypothetical protein
VALVLISRGLSSLILTLVGLFLVSYLRPVNVQLKHLSLALPLQRPSGALLTAYDYANSSLRYDFPPRDRPPFRLPSRVISTQLPSFAQILLYCTVFDHDYELVDAFPKLFDPRSAPRKEIGVVRGDPNLRRHHHYLFHHGCHFFFPRYCHDDIDTSDK